jgi:hypothetical protein
MSWLPSIEKLDPKQKALLNFVVMQNDTGLQKESAGIGKASDRVLKDCRRNRGGVVR